MRVEIHRRQSRVALRLMLTAWALMGTVGYANDDVIIDTVETGSAAPTQGGFQLAGNVVIQEGQVLQLRPGGRQPEYDLGGLFDQQAFGRGSRQNGVVIINGNAVAHPAVQPATAHEQALAAVRQRCEQRIETIERICGLDARQVRTLEVALESDLKRIGSQIEAAREPYAGRTIPATPQGLDRGILEEVRVGAIKCRQLLDTLPGQESLLGTVVHDLLSPEQLAAFEAWIESRRACRWKAMVKTVLVQLDEASLGLSAAQAATLEEILLADVPKLDVLRDGRIGNLDARMSHFQTILVAGRLSLRKPAWQNVLDPRQQMMLEAHFGSAGNPASVERMLMDQGILEPHGEDESRVKETK